ncbi:MAG: ATP-binding protein [Kiritimatiellae bacterium]|nr:ATP-binding protein [Kiritimatiellia bacterium]
MYRRDIYMRRIRPFLGKPVVKVVTGMRRVGKSCFLRQVIDELKADGVPATSILYIDKESLEFEHVQTYRDLGALVEQALGKVKGAKFLFVDEVQEIQEWEKAIASIGGKGAVDVTLTGSNAHLFSSELATRLSGRYVEIPVYSLGFKEHLLFRGGDRRSDEEEFRAFLRFGGLPAVHHLPREEEIVYQYVSSIYSTVLLKDVVRRHEVRNVSLLERIAGFLFDNVGRVTSAKSIADYIKSQRLRASVETVQTYLSYFEQAQLAHRVARYDIKGRRQLELYDKYYLGDVGMRHAVLGFREDELSGVLENVVFLELRRRGYRVRIGKLREREVDFIAEREKEKLYVQVAYLLATPEVIAREFGVLKAVPDNYEKLVLSLDTQFGDDLDGIRRRNLIEFLLD